MAVSHVGTADSGKRNFGGKNMLQTRGIMSCLAAILLLTSIGSAQNLLVNPNFNSDTSGWTLRHTEDTLMSFTWEATSGNPGGAVKLMRTDGALASNGHRFYQAIPVTVGQSYVIQGQWKGDLGTGTSTAAGEGYDWAEIFVGFSASAEPLDGEFGTYYLKKRFKLGDTGSYGTNATGQWDWEQITASPSVENGFPIYFVATQPYMVLSFNLGGQPNGGQAWYTIDNLKVMACSQYPTGDLSSDCRVNFSDMAVMASGWLTCGLDPAISCW
jgi:hypothetical protein